MKKLLVAVICSLLWAVGVHAQWNLGIGTGNWSGTNSLFLNPANLADSRTNFCIDVLSLNAGVDNNLGTLNVRNSVNKFMNGNNTNINDVFNFSNNDQFSLLAPYIDIHGPGIMFNSRQKHFFAFTTRVRAVNQFNNFNKSLYRTINDTTTINTQSFDLTAPSFNWTAHAWTETAFSYGTVLLDKGMSKLKIGATIKYLGGIGYIGIKGNNLDLHFRAKTDSFYATRTDLEYGSSFIDAGHAATNGIFSNNPITDILGSKAGAGVGGDFGLVYEYKEDTVTSKYDMDGKKGIKDRSKNHYKLRISASVTDIGSVTYLASTHSSANILVSGSGYLTGNGLKNNVKDFTSFKDYAMKQGFTVDTGAHDTKLYLPTTMIIGADYHAYKNIYVNATYFANLANIHNFGNTFYNTFAITPRWDTRKLSMALPISYSSLARDIKLGFGVRYGGFYIGSNDMLAFFSNGNYGLNFYMGGFVPFNFKMPKDRDHDGVSDKRDKCPDVPGLWEYKGCPDPDRDHDGIPDSVDNCPDIPGAKSANGCPDRDGDGVEDDMDRCPDVAGPVALQGCPDRDHDGVPDIDDKCPDVPGDASMHGCPDTDGDGIPDNEDSCKTVAGPAATHGCPDADGDGIPDYKDACPNEPGPADNHGCPVKKVEVRQHIKLSETVLHLQNGKADFGKADYTSLDRIAQLMKEHHEYSLEIEGHTDNVGDADKNLDLSQERAEMVKEYFVNKGIDASRVNAKGFGDTKPHNNNKTAADRAKNRRVVVRMESNEVAK